MAMFVLLNLRKNGGAVMVKIKKIFSLMMCVCFLSLTMTAPIFAASDGTSINNIVSVWASFINMNNGNKLQVHDASPGKGNYYFDTSVYTGSGYITTYILFNGAPKNASFNMSIDYTVTGNVELVNSTKYTTGNDIDYETLYHRTGYYVNLGAQSSTYNGSYNTVSTTNGNNTLTFKIINNAFASNAISICYYVSNLTNFSLNIKRIYFTTDEDVINQSLNEINTPSTADKEKTDAFKNKSDSQSQSLNDSIASAGDYDKPQGDSIAPAADDYIDTQSVSSYNNVLGVITNNNIVITMLLTVCSIALIGYVLFGKR